MGPNRSGGAGAIAASSPAIIEGIIESQRASGYKAVKLYELLDAATYRAGVRAAKEKGLQVWTHVPVALSLDDVMALGVHSIEHLDDYAPVVRASNAPALTPRDGISDTLQLWADADPEKIDQLAVRLSESEIWSSPTLAVVLSRYFNGADPDGYFARDEAAYLGPGLRQWWTGSAEAIARSVDAARIAQAPIKAMVRSLHARGAGLLIGTDAPNPFTALGFSIHDELAHFEDAGIPTADVFRIATREAARFLNAETDFGVIAPGARADLVLLAADPRTDLDTLRAPLAVIVNGHYYSRERIDEDLARLRAARAP